MAGYVPLTLDHIDRERTVAPARKTIATRPGVATYTVYFVLSRAATPAEATEIERAWAPVTITGPHGAGPVTVRAAPRDWLALENTTIAAVHNGLHKSLADAVFAADQVGRRDWNEAEQEAAHQAAHRAEVDRLATEIGL